MSDPPRLLDRPESSASTLELLRALEPPQAMPPAVKVALVRDLSGLVASAGLKAAGLGLALKASLLGVLVLGAGSAVYFVRTPSEVPTPASMPRPLVVPPPAVAAPPVAVAPVTVAPPAPPSPPSASPPERSRTASPPRDALAEEEALLEAARQASARDPARALSLLRQHQSRFPSGQLGAERLFLSVECWQRLGNASAARREAAALVKAYPNSAYARRVAQLAPSKAP